MRRTAPVVIGILHKNGKFLLTRRSESDTEDAEYHNYWQLPGGGVEFAEDPVDALSREMREETGIEISDIQLLPKVFTEVRGNWQGLFICYICKMADDNALIILNDESNAYKWCDLEEAKELKSLPGTNEILKEANKLI